jgi:outer membrane murein-binding lipoprotein Lpp
MSDGAITAIVGGVVAIAGGVGKYLLERAKIKGLEKEVNRLNKKLRASESSNTRLKKLLK